MNKNLENKKHWIYGKHAVKAALSNKNRACYRLFATSSSLKELDIVAKANHPDLVISVVENKEINKLVGTDALHQNLALEVEKLAEKTLDDFLNNNNQSSCIVALDQLTDPHNIGAILRSAAAFSADAVLITDYNSPKDSGTIAKISSGAMEIVPFIKITNLSQSLNRLKDAGYWIVGLEGTSPTQLDKVKLDGKIVLVMGSEGTGLRRLTKDTCDILAKLPINPAMESLNVSNAAAIALYECYKQNNN